MSQRSQFSCKRVQPCAHCLPQYATKTIKTLSVPAKWPRQSLIGNLLYKPTLVPAASRCAHIVCSLDVLNSCFVLRTRSGPGEKTGRSASQAGHGAAERCAKQEIYRRRFGVHQQTCKRWGVLRSPETELEKLFWNTRLLHNAILFSDLPRWTHRVRGFVTANTANSKATYASQTARGVRDAPQSGKKVASRAYPGNRPFLNEGTNQKSLNRQNEPLTIEQVRELLNKNK